jgi:hypothetical protein
MNNLNADQLYTIAHMAQHELDSKIAYNMQDFVQKHCLPRAALGYLYCNVSEEEIGELGSYEYTSQAFADLGFECEPMDVNGMVTISWYRI